jgi:hypothetical protein
MSEIARLAIRGLEGVGLTLLMVTLAYLLVYLPQKWADLF